MTKKGSQLSEAINPCIRRAMQSAFYADLCEKYIRLGFTDIKCYENEYFSPRGQEEEEDEDDGVDEGAAPAPAPEPSATRMRGDCSSGYCGCSL